MIIRVVRQTLSHLRGSAAPSSRPPHAVNHACAGDSNDAWTLSSEEVDPPAAGADGESGDSQDGSAAVIPGLGVAGCGRSS
jgi:hypothetical protein